VSDKPNLVITAVNAFQFKEITEVHNAHVKMLLEDDERDHVVAECAPSLIKSRFFPHTTNLLTVLTFLHFEIPYMYTRGES